MVDKKPHILIVPSPGLFPLFEGDRSGIFVLDYIRAIKPYYDVSVLFPQTVGSPKGRSQKMEGGISVHRYNVAESPSRSPLHMIFRYLNWYKESTKWGKALGPFDLIHAHGATLAGSIANSLSRSLKIPYIITEHSNPFSKITNSSVVYSACKRAMEQSNCVLAVSTHLSKEISSAGIHPRRVEVSYNPVDTNTFQLRELKEGLREITFVGRLVPYKGALSTLKALAEIGFSKLDWHFNIIGTGPEEQALRNFIESNPEIEKRVSLVGDIPKNEIADYLKRSAFFVHPSKHESFGISIAEAISCGVPVVVGDQTAPPEFVDPSCGILVDASNYSSIKNGIREMIDRFGEFDSPAMRRQITERFSIEVFGKKMQNIYNSLIQST